MNTYIIAYVVRAPPEIDGDVITYSNVIAFDILLNGINTTFSTTFHAIGETRTPPLAGIVSALLNFILDHILIRGAGIIPPLGVAGAALATLISRGVKFLY